MGVDCHCVLKNAHSTCLSPCGSFFVRNQNSMILLPILMVLWSVLGAYDEMGLLTLRAENKEEHINLKYHWHSEFHR